MRARYLPIFLVSFVILLSLGLAKTGRAQAPTATIVAFRNISCNGLADGQITVSASGGTTPYSYKWSTSPQQTTSTANSLTVGTYTVTVTGNNGLTASASKTLTQPPVPSAGANQTICIGNSAQLQATGGVIYAWSPTTGLNNPNISNPVATPTVTTTYTVTVSNVSGDLVTNGNFELGNTGFISAYAYVPNPLPYPYNPIPSGNQGLWPEGTYAVCPNAHVYHALFNGHGRGGTGLFMAVNGSTVPGTSVWSENVTVLPNTVYNFNAWLCTLHLPGPFATLNFSINSVLIGPTLQAPNDTNDFIQFNAAWNSGASTSALIQIVNTTTVAGSNDFGLDDILFTTVCSQTATVTVTVSNIAVNMTHTNSCNGSATGSATANPSGGIVPYTYKWNTTPQQTTQTISGLAASTYIVTVTDANSCTKTASVTISQPPTPLSAITSHTNVGCEDEHTGIASVTASGGSPGYTYIWSTTPAQTTRTISSLHQGTYIVTVTDSQGCTSSSSTTVSEVEAPVVTTSSTPVSCNGGSNGTATATITVCDADYNLYHWSNGQTGASSIATITGLVAGTYTVTFTDSDEPSHTVSASVSVTQPVAPLTTTAFAGNENCTGENTGTTTANPSGGTPGYSYLWSTTPAQTSQTATGLSASTYSVTVTDSRGCTTTTNTTVSEGENPNITIAATPVSCFGGSNGTATATITVCDQDYRLYKWSNGQTGFSSVAPITGLSAGTYTVTFTDADEPTHFVTASVTVSQPEAGLFVLSGQTKPVSCKGGSDGQATVLALGGWGSYIYHWSNNQTITDITGLSAATYTVTVTDLYGCTSTSAAVISEPTTALSASASQTKPVSCKGGSNGEATVTASGGWGSYYYKWTNTQTTATATGLAAGTYTVTVTDLNGCNFITSATVSEPANPLSAIASQTKAVSCSSGGDGQATVTASGGWGSYQYKWTNGQTSVTTTGLIAGTYTVTVTDLFGCSTTASAVITQPAGVLSVQAFQTKLITCKGGSDGQATAFVFDGTTPYHYLWNNGETTSVDIGLTAGTYTVTVTDFNGCNGTASTIVSEPVLPLSAIASQTKPVTCKGGSDGQASVTATGGWGSYQYRWINSQTTTSISSLAAGTYTVTVTDLQGCTTTASAIVSEPAAPLSASALQFKPVTCKGGSDGQAVVTASGGWGSYHYHWNNSQSNALASGLAAGTYTVTVTDLFGCTTVASAVVSEPSVVLSVTAAATHNVTCRGGSDGSAGATASGGWGSYKYLWSNTQTTPAISGLIAGNYTVTVTDLLGCTTSGSAVITQPPAFLNASAAQTKPVTCKGGSDGAAGVTASGGSGSFSYLWSNGQTLVTITGLHAGTYTVTVSDISGGCTTSSSATVSEPTLPLSAAVSPTHQVSCKGGSDGSAAVTASGGWGSYNYLWSNGKTTASNGGLIAGTYTVTVTDLLGCTTTGNAVITEPAGSLTASSSQTKAITCFGGNDGMASVTASGGTTTYSYLWTNGQTGTTSSGLMALTYTVTVTDNHGCTTASSVTLTQASVPLTATADHTNETCQSETVGTATAQPVGGVPAYNYLWSTLPAQTTQTATGLSEATYTVTVTDHNGCTTTTSATIEENDVPTLTMASTPVSCFGGNNGTATATITVCDPDYKLYHWSNGQSGFSSIAAITGLSAGTYTVTFTDADEPTHMISASVNVLQPQSGVGLTAKVTPVTCYGQTNGSICITVFGGTPNYYYVWSNGVTATGSVGFTHCINNLSAGSYTVTVTDANSCSIVRSWSVTQPNLLVATASSTPISCSGQSNGTATVTATGGNGGYLYLWSNAQTTQTISNLVAGTYTITVTDSKGCSGSSSTTISVPIQNQVYAGPDQFLCNQAQTFLIGSNPAPGTGNWTEYTGPNTALIFPPNAQTVIVANMIPGVYKFIYTVTSGQCTVTDTVMVTNYHYPTAAFAGLDQQLCKSPAGPDSTWMNGNTPVWGMGKWSEISGPNMAHFVNPDSPVTKVTNLINGVYDFRWSIGDGVCDSSYDDVLVTVHTMPTAYAGPDATICGNSMDTLNSSSATNYVQLSWITTGTGYFNNSGTLHPIYTPSSFDVTAGYVKLILVVTGYPGCGNVSDTMQLNLTAPPIANAGPDASICSYSDFCLCGATAYHYTSVWWTTTGCGTFNHPNSLNPVYTPCPADIIAGCIKLIMHVMGTPPCGVVTDTVELCIHQIPVVYAGPDTTICSQGTYTILLSTALYQASLKWKTSGDGTFNKDTILHPTYTPGSGDLAAGHVTLTLIGIGCSPCPNDTDSMVLTFSYPPVVHASTVTNVICNGGYDGAVTVSVSGGHPPYHYLWSDAAHQTTQMATGLSAGIYTVTVTDYYMCTGTSSTTVTQPPQLIVQCTGSDVTCYTYSNGSVTITVSGGTPAYSYWWSNGRTTQNITGLSAGTYTVLVTDSHGCTTTCSSMITQPPPWGPQICGLDSVCQGSTVTYCVCESQRPNSTFEWTVTCGTLVDGCCSHCQTIKWGNCTQGTICVTETRHDFPYDGCVITTCKTIILKPVPQPVITGPMVVMAGQTGAVYCTPFYPGHLYSWSVIDGTVTSGQGTNCITVTWNTPCNSCMGQVIAYETENGCCGTDTMNVTIIPGTGNLDGYVNYKNSYNTGLNGVTVTLRNSLGVQVGMAYTGPNTANSNQPGYYTFPGIPDGTYRLTASFNGTWGGNNATDALIIELYTVNLYPLNGIYWKSGDVTSDMSVNATDALWVKLRTVGMMSSYPAGDWIFTDTTFTLTTMATVNLQGLCTGDVNGSYIPTMDKESSFLSVAADGIMTVPVNKDFIYPIRSSMSSELGAMTLFMGYNAEQFEVEDVTTTLEGLKYVISDGEVKLAWSNTKPLALAAEDPILTMKIKAKEPVTTPVQIFDVKPGSEFADAGAVRYDNYELKMANVVSPGNTMGFTINNFPNPFRNTTDIVYTIPEQGHVKLVLTNLFGEELRTLVDADQVSGSYTVRVNPTDYNLNPGVYMYRIKVDGATSTYVKTNKMIFTH